jgi:hypothetical protein
MLALIYLALAIHIGDFLCRRFYRFVPIGRPIGSSRNHRAANQFMVCLPSRLLFARAKPPLFAIRLLQKLEVCDAIDDALIDRPRGFPAQIKRDLDFPALDQIHDVLPVTMPVSRQLPQRKRFALR